MDRLRRELGVPARFAEILLRRELGTAAGIRSFLVPHLDDLHDPFALPDMEPAVDRIQRAIREGEPILVHGDYDADGMTATALLTLGLRRAGARVEPFVPHRTRDGYDLSEAGLEHAARAGCGLIVTADCGVTAVAAVARAVRRGMDVIVTDHHRPGPKLPPAVAVIDPLREDSVYPFRGLAGVGVAFKLVRALFRKAGLGDEESNRHLDLVAIGTVADQMPLLDENRALVRGGLLALRRTDKPGLRALLARAGLSGTAPVGAEDISFRLGPRLNSVGRMVAADPGLQLLLTEDEAEGRRLAAYLEKQNADRRSMDRHVHAAVETRLADRFDPDRHRSVVVWGDEWHPGVIGIVASRLCEAYQRPAVVISFDGETGRGSGRSVPGFHLFRALAELEPLLERFGGHRLAAGLTIRRDRIDEFADRFEAIAARELVESPAAHDLPIDLELGLDEADAELEGWLARLEPFGTENPRPLLASRGVCLQRPGVVGPRGAHLRVELASPGAEGKRLGGIGFGLGDQAEGLTPDVLWDIAFHLETNHWNGNAELQARIVDIRPAGT
ncbi:MAG: single-stranded-DNA-specific exonuclease RecJ [Gemmatimonadota bacterium]|nr:single-stranded-DNA-specific exonuclease RecJ [Gemmatimonadota bacterium]